MLTGLWIGLILAASTPDNLLVNPGFEQVKGERPVGWELFVQPKDGAYGELDSAAYSGLHSALLHTAEPYTTDPVNNWSQSLFVDLGGKTLQVSGNIKTEDATEAALWVQCWQSRPAQVLYTGMTSSVSRVAGTADWTPVNVDVPVPKGTDFVIVRCVLRGTGTAWFDDLSATIAPEEEAKPAETTTEPASTEVKPEPSSATLSATATTAAPNGESSTSNTKTTSTPLPASPPLSHQEDAALKALLDANKALAETVTVLQQSNRALREQFDQIERELDALRAKLAEVQAVRSQLATERGAQNTLNSATPIPPEATAPEPATEPLILVPHSTPQRSLAP